MARLLPLPLAQDFHYATDRPTFEELEDAVRATKEPAASPAAPDAMPTPA